jgi:hypothetical protein
MKIPNFVNLKNFISQDERTWLVLVLDAMLSDTTVFIRTLQGDVVEGHLAINLPHQIRVFFEDLRGKIK